MKSHKRVRRRLAGYSYLVVLLAVLTPVFLFFGCTPAKGSESGGNHNSDTRYDRTIFVMDTLVTQTAYGDGAKEAMDEVNRAFSAYEERLSLYKEDSDISRLNAASGKEWVEINKDTFDLLSKATSLSEKSEGAFAVTIAPLTLAWGITSDEARIPPDDEIKELVGLVDDKKLLLKDGKAMLADKGMGVDLGGIAKGASCALAEEIYADHDVNSALLSIGGNVYAKGTKPDGSKWRVGFRDPLANDETYLASFPLENRVIAVSGGYERYSVIDGGKYIHILDPETGYPAQSDIVSVGVIDLDGALADFYSTTLFVWGLEKSLDFIRGGGTAIILDDENNLYIPESLENGFRMYDEVKEQYKLVVVERKTK